MFVKKISDLLDATRSASRDSIRRLGANLSLFEDTAESYNRILSRLSVSSRVRDEESAFVVATFLS
jgi:hypothetical protein